MFDLQTIVEKNAINPARQLKLAFANGVLSEDEVVEAVQDHLHSLEDPGFCLICGNRHEGVEPDAEGYECEHCGEFAVYGAEQLLFYIM